MPIIAYNATLLTPAGSGVERAVREQARALLARGAFDYRLIAPADAARDTGLTGAGRAAPLTVPVWAGRARGLRILWEQAVLPARLRRGGAALLHAPAYVAPFRTPCPYVVSVYDLHVFTHPCTCSLANRLHYRALLPTTLRRAAAILVPSQHVGHVVRARFPQAAPRLAVVPLGVDATFAPVTAPDRLDRLRARLGLPPRYLLFVGNLAPRKNLPALLDLLAELSPTDPGLHLALAGAPAPATADLEARARRLGVLDRIHRLGFVADGDLPALYGAATALVHPAVDEGFGLTVLEALACGCPVIATDAAAREVAGEAALLCEPAGIGQLAAAVRRLDAEPGLRAHLVKAGPRRAAAFTWNHTAAILETVYRRILGESPLRKQVPITNGP